MNDYMDHIEKGENSKPGEDLENYLSEALKSCRVHRERKVKMMIYIWYYLFNIYATELIERERERIGKRRYR